jgi:antitoxin component of MazEF toxin-antitoxin module
MNVTQDLQKWGNSTGIRLPKKVIAAAKLHPNQTMIISIVDGSIVLTPLKVNHDLTLESMLNGVTPEMVNGEIDWGEDVGSEEIYG